jgi:hypothetical protein
VVEVAREELDDDALARRLGAALDDGLDSPVDTTSLLAGARTGARRIRRRRRAGTAVLTVLAIAAVPTGYQALQPEAVSRQIASAPPTTGSPPATALSSSAPATGPSTKVTLVSLAAPESIPGEIAFRLDDLDRPLDKILDLGNYAKVAPVDGQSCDAGSDPSKPLPSAGRHWMWAENGGVGASAASVSLTVTGWAGGGGSQAIRDVAADEGHCQFLDPVQEVPLGDLPVDGGWAGTSTTPEGDLSSGYAAVELGDVLVSVTVRHADGPDAAVAEARRLVEVAAERTVVALG